ncbi:hypothetical protein FBY31_1755 [Arthrobacter sp. SLBN-100]|nr:hypothetical protein FBY31_1755 [Arthrobacter sp. SLBN-100]
MKKQNKETSSMQAEATGRGFARGWGGAGIAGGLCLTASAIMQAMQPPGCIAEECVGRTYRSAGPFEALLFLAGIVLIVAATLAFLAAQPAAPRTVRIAAVAAAAGMFIGFALMGSVLYLAGLALVVVAIAAYVVLGISVASSRVLPVWAGVLLAASALLLLGANDQNERILFVVPFALTWIVLGALLWTSAPRSQGRTGNVQVA